MKKWVLKAIVQKVISFLPFSQKINFLFQKYVTKGVVLTDEYFFDKLGLAYDHLYLYQKHSGKEIPESCLELGSGWYPILPLCFFLNGANNIQTIDIALLTSKKRLQTTICRMIRCYEDGVLESYITIIPERIEVLKSLVEIDSGMSLQEILQKLNINYIIGDARKLTILDDNIDLIYSNNTLEHIYPDVLKSILTEFKRVIKKEKGVMSHFVDMSDHFAHFDHSITIYNFLKFSDRQWKWIDNTVQPMNRLRIYDYREIYKELNLPVTEIIIRKGYPNDLLSIKTDNIFSGKPAEEVAVSHCHFVSAFNL
jgi:hypothetical protein